MAGWFICSFRPIFLMGSCLHKGVSLEFVRYWNHPPKKRRRLVTILSRCWVFGLICPVLQASSEQKTTKHIPPDDGCHVWWFGRGCEILSVCIFSVDSLSDRNGFHERVLKHSYIASSMCAMTRQTQLHSIQRVCKDKTNTVA